MTSTLLTFLVLSIANGFISLTVTKSQIFAGVRDFFFNFAAPDTIRGKILAWLYELINCPYCFSHWVALVMVWIWQPRLTDCGYVLIDLCVSIFAMVGVAGYAWGIFYKLTELPEK
jgi:hypothetical protein